MNEESFTLLLFVLNVLLCLSIIFIQLWRIVGEKKSRFVPVLLMVGLLALLLYQMFSGKKIDTLIIFVCLLVIMELMVKNRSKLQSADDQSIYANKLHEMTVHAQEQERSRIYANLHDDVGAQLLSLIYAAKDQESRTIAKKVLHDIRQAVASTQHIQLTAEKFANELIEESLTRLQEANIAMQYQLDLFDGRQKVPMIVPNVVCRIVREVVSNVIKHAKASQLNVVVSSTQATLSVNIEDNGVGFVLADETQGKGFKTIKKRAESIDAKVQWRTSKEQGCVFTLTCPL